MLPGIYGLKATGSLFLPTLRENLHITASSKLVVNLTLSTLYEAFRWLPAQPRQADEPQDDWTWTLRLSANRPLLRMLEDGPLVVVTEAEGQNPALKARVTIRGGESSFGDGGVHHGFEMRRSNDDSRQLILRADLSQAEDPALIRWWATSNNWRQAEPFAQSAPLSIVRKLLAVLTHRVCKQWCCVLLKP